MKIVPYTVNWSHYLLRKRTAKKKTTKNKKENKTDFLGSWLFLACRNSTDPLSEMIVHIKFLGFSQKYSEGGYTRLTPSRRKF